MAVVYAGKVFSGVITDNVNTFYSDPDCNAKLGAGEKYYLEMRATNVNGAPTLTISLESSNDNVNWVVRSAALISTAGLTTGTVTAASEPGTTTVGGRFQRFSLKFTVGTTPSGYIELWVTARNAF